MLGLLIMIIGLLFYSTPLW